VVEHLVALVPCQGPAQPRRQRGERLDQPVADQLRAVAATQWNQDRVSRLAFHERGDRRALTGPDQQITFPVAELSTRLDDRGPLVDRPQVGQLLQRAIAAASSPTAMPIGPASAQRLAISDHDPTPIDRLIDRLVAHMPPSTSRPTTPCRCRARW
jgi:hypothetical protein